MDYLEFANSPLMWVLVTPGILTAVIQSFLFARQAWKTGKEMSLTTQQLKNSVKASATGAVGPALVGVSACLALITTLGGPMALMRLNLIGNVAFELNIASIAAEMAGGTLSGDGMTLNIFATCCWTLCFCCIGWPLVSLLFTHRMETLKKKAAKGNSAILGIVAGCSAMGMYTYMTTERIYQGKGPTIAVVTAMAIQTAISLYGKKTQKAWCAKWGMIISMFVSMAFTAIVV